MAMSHLNLNRALKKFFLYNSATIKIGAIVSLMLISAMGQVAPGIDIKIAGVNSLKQMLQANPENLVWLMTESDTAPDDNPFSEKTGNYIDISKLIKNSQEDLVVVTSKAKVTQLVFFSPFGGLESNYYLKVNNTNDNIVIPQLFLSKVLLDSNFKGGEMVQFKTNNLEIAAEFYSRAEKMKNGDVVCDYIRIKDIIYFVTKSCELEGK
jgi:hypothetical protein